MEREDNREPRERDDRGGGDGGGGDRRGREEGGGDRRGGGEGGDRRGGGDGGDRRGGGDRREGGDRRGGEGGGGSQRNPQIYIGGITRDVSTSDIRKKFAEYGHIANLSIKNRYAFVVSIKNVFSQKNL